MNEIKESKVSCNGRKISPLVSLAISSLICILPLIFGLIIWKKLPSKIPVHWNLKGEISSYSPKAFVVFAIPIICFVLNLFEHISVELKKRSGIDYGKFEIVCKWIIPFISLFVCTMFYLASFKIAIKFVKIIFVAILVVLLLAILALLVISKKKLSSITSSTLTSNEEKL